MPFDEAFVFTPPPSSVATINKEKEKMLSSTGESTLHEPLSIILTQISLDLTPAKEANVLVFVDTSNKVLAVVTDTGRKKPDLVALICTQSIAKRFVRRELTEADKETLCQTPHAYELYGSLEMKTGKANVDDKHVIQFFHHLCSQSRHRPGSDMQYGLSINRRGFQLVALLLDHRVRWPKVSWTDPDWLKRLYYYVKLLQKETKRTYHQAAPERSKIVEVNNRSLAIYDAQLGEQKFRLLPIFTGRGNGRKAFVAIASTQSTDQGLVYKSYWAPDGHARRELDILRAVQDVPGVVQVDEFLSHVIPASPDARTTRSLVILIMKTVGYSLSSCKTVLEFLECMYDLIEVIRYLACELKILHRDISWGNVLLPSVEEGTNTRPEKKSSSGHGIKHSYRYISDIYNEDKFKVRVALADFDNAVKINADSDELQDATGTPMFMANDLISPRACARDSPMIYSPPVVHVLGVENSQESDGPSEVGWACMEDAQDELADKLRKYDAEEGQAWDEFYREKLQSLEWKVKPGGSMDPADTFTHGAVHDAESVFCLCLLFFSRMWPFDKKVESSKIDQLLVDRGRILRSLARKEIGKAETCSFQADHALPSTAFDTDEKFKPFYDMLNAVNVYLQTPWYNVAETGFGERYEFHLHEFMQRLFLREIRRLRESKDHIALEERPLPVRTDSSTTGDEHSRLSEAIPSAPNTRKVPGASDHTKAVPGRRRSLKRSREQTTDANFAVMKRLKRSISFADVRNDQDEAVENNGADEAAVNTGAATTTVDVQPELPVARTKKVTIPNKLKAHFSSKHWDICCCKLRERLWLTSDKD